MPRSLRDVVSQIDNTRDLNAYVTSFALKVGSSGDIKYERHPVGLRSPLLLFNVLTPCADP